MKISKQNHYGHLTLLKVFCVGLFLGIIMAPVWAFCQGTDVERQGSIRTPLHEKANGRYIEGEVLVKFKPGIETNDVISRMGAYGLNIKKGFNVLSKIKGRMYALVASDARSTAQLMADMEQDAMVDTVSPNFIRKIDSIPNDTSFNSLWGLHNTGQSGGTVDADIDAPEAWDVSTGSTNVIVAVIDTGVGYDHEDLAANMWTNPLETPGNGIDDDVNGYIDDVYGIDTVNGDSDPMDDNGHGSHCAGTIAAVGNNGKGVVGVNWTARIMALKAGSSLGGLEDDDTIEAIEYVIDQKVNRNQNIVAINASWGGGDDNPLLSDAIEAAGDAGIVFCAAAGNDNEDNDTTPHYPSSYNLKSIIAVASTTRTDDLSSFSCYGAVSVDLGAPGSTIYSTVSYFDAPVDGNIFYDNMESGFGNWSSGGTNNTWAITDDRESFYVSGATRSFGTPPSGTHFLSDSPGTDYAFSTDSWVGSKNDIDLSGYADQAVYFSFGSAFVCDWWLNEKAIVEISNNSGTDWTTLFDLSDWYLYWSFWGWGSDVIVIPNSFKTANFRFRFHFTSNDADDDANNDDAGWVIDDVGIGTTLTKTYQNYSGTSMATPHVAGAVALLAAKHPNESVALRKNRILKNVDKIAALSGKTVTGGRLNVLKAINASPSALPAVHFLLMQ